MPYEVEYRNNQREPLQDSRSLLQEAAQPWVTLPERSNCTELTTSSGAKEAAGESRGHWKKQWPHKVILAVTWELTLSSTFISASSLQSAGDFQLPGCNHSSLHNLTFHPEPLICAWGCSAAFCRALISHGRAALGAAAHPHHSKASCFHV